MQLVDIIIILFAIAMVWYFIVRPLVVKGARGKSGIGSCNCGCSECHYKDDCHDIKKERIS